MTTYTIDTYEAVRQFVAAGIPDKQAEVIVAAISRADSEVVTKADLRQEIAAVRTDLKQEVADLRQEIAAVRTDLKQEVADLRQEIAAVRTDLKQEVADLRQEIAAVRTDLKQEVAGVKADLRVLRADVGAELSTAINKMLLAQIAVAGLLFAAIKLF